MAEDSDMTPNTEKAGEEVEGITESANKPDLNAPPCWERKMFNLYFALLIGMVYTIANGLSYYYFYEGWETTLKYRKAAMVVGAISVVMLPFVGGFVIYLYFHMRENEKTE